MEGTTLEQKTFNIRTTNKEEEQRKSVCLEQLAQDRQQLLIKWPFIGSIIMRMELVPVRDDRLCTASTNGDSIFVDINFYAKLTREQRLFVLAHEVWHCVMLHIARTGKRHRDLFNIAIDLEVHFTLLDEKMSEPFVLPHEPSWAKLSAEEIYEELLKLQSGKKLSSEWCSGKISKNFETNKKSFDKHIFPNESEENTPSNTSTDDAECDFVIDKDYRPIITLETIERTRARVISAAQQIERTQGHLPANLVALLDKLQTPSLPWQELLKQFVTTCYGGKRLWLPPARRHVWQDMYLPSMRDEQLKTVVALDTSGSTEYDLALFFGELVSLMRSFGRFELTVIQCDADIHDVQIFTDARIPASNHRWKIKGGGGTDFRPVFDYVHKKSLKPDLLLFFTDGYGDAPVNPPPYPMMWVLTTDSRTPAPWGRVTHFTSSK
jgi:predicted metal-dependent peptidase